MELLKDIVYVDKTDDEDETDKAELGGERRACRALCPSASRINHLSLILMLDDTSALTTQDPSVSFRALRLISTPIK
jgi:hypothetical protein